MDSGVLSIVSSNNVEIFRHLGAAHLKRAGIQHRVGADMESLRMLIRQEMPTLVILDVILPGGSGYELCREIKGDADLKHTHVILLQGSVMSLEDVTKTAESGCDDVLALPLHPDDFYYHLAQMTGVALRTSHRVAVEMEVTLQREGLSVEGKVFNVSNQGLGIKVSEEIPLGPMNALLVHGDTRYESISGEIMWCHDSQEHYAVGLQFGEIPPTTRGLLARLSLYQVVDSESGDCVTVIMQGSFDEQTDFGPLLAELESARIIDFVLNGVQYLSSSGVQSWCLFLDKLSRDTFYSFRNCSVEFASQAAMVPMSVARGKVISVQAPYFCETCDREETRLIECALVRLADGSLHAPLLHCHICANALTFDDLPERYFAFLADQGE